MNRVVLFIITFFFGFLGVHRFATGKIGTGVLYLFTAGLFGIGVIVDLVMIAIGNFKTTK